MEYWLIIWSTQYLRIIIDCLFYLSFKNPDNDLYCLPLVEIKGVNALIDNKPFFDQPVTTKNYYKAKLQNYYTHWFKYKKILALLNKLIS